MNRKQLSWIATGAALAAITAAAPSIAHHAFAAEFDSSKPVALDGTITKARFVNPHSWVYVDVRDRTGKVTNWGFEFGTPSSLRAKGLDKTDVAFGTKVHIDGFRAKNGGPFGYAVSVTLPGGRKVQTGSAPDAPR
ncbi:MAG: hypothetical protein J7500_09570 [Sphingomonas sp.]|uniref:DUF6152 family protein n=1 Tax=Sphingomonas sp. TaxID=28214 RepID=UPI001B051FAE|nr:DUF6152 family protein [Sphingomonas sp.]MBO9622947.1 hypothetical protein [Sphingomonas sp.]